ncbi:MAG: iron-containing alcohol dehydrogenase [Bacillota bacterium]|nr:MAG: alcohol dehydrogenase [Bacillota bacterium]
MLPRYYEFYNPVKVLSGEHALENLPYEMAHLSAQRPILLTNQQLMEVGLVRILEQALAGSNLTIAARYTEIPQDSSIHVVNGAGRIFREAGCDSIIALGGGSVIDTAKGLRILIGHEADDILQYMGADILQPKRHVPLAVIPTTAGTGSEATLVAVIAHPERQVKMEFVSHHLLPDLAVLDPRMTRSLPPRITASTGMDALVHAIEAYTSIQRNPLSDAYAWAAIELIRDYLPRAVENGQDTEARLAMANAALMAGAAFSNAMVGLVHAIGHAVGAVGKVAHGDAMAILLPHVMEYNLDLAHERYGRLLLALAGPERYAATPADRRGAEAIAVVRAFTERLHRACGLPLRLRDVGVTEDMLPAIGRTAIDDGALLMNPKEAGLDDVLQILRQAL